MSDKDSGHSADRRLFLGGTALGLLGVTSAVAQPAPASRPPAVPAGGETLSQILAQYIAGFDLKAVPRDVLRIARISFIDTVGVMLAGSQEQISSIACDMVKAEASAPAATIVGQSLRASPQLAALANGIAGHAMDYDFTYISGQSVSAVIPAILPVAETVGASPAECLAAFIIGCEVSGRIVRSNFNASLLGGWHTTGMVGVIAAAAACARLMKVPVEAIPNVLGITTSLASGVSANFGTMTKPLHAGNAARNAVTAAQLGSRGFTALPAAFEHHSGYFADFGRGLDVSYESFEDLGSKYALDDPGPRLKAYPCGGLTHSSIEAALALREKLGARVADISAIHCAVTKNAGGRAGTQWPSSVEGAKFSVSYLVAYSLIHGAPRLPAFTEEALKDGGVKTLAAKVTASVDPALGPGTNVSPAIVKITLKDGQVFEQRRDQVTGTKEVPMTQAQVEEKFMDCALHAVTADNARKILAILNALPEQSSFDSLWPLLRRA
jgi:2-methylcitrate dehydratase PrpD